MLTIHVYFCFYNCLISINLFYFSFWGGKVFEEVHQVEGGGLEGVCTTSIFSEARVCQNEAIISVPCL